MLKKLIVFCILMLVIATNAIAHDAWLVKDGKDFTVIYGHSDKTEPYNPEKVKSIKPFDTAGREIRADIRVISDRVVVTPRKDPCFISLHFDNGFWVKTIDGYKNISKVEAKDYIESFHSVKYSKAILKWSNKLAKPIGVKMEIVPMKNPLSLKAGDNLPLKVFLDGKPAEGVSINAGGYHKDDTKTDKNGMVEVRIEKSGFQIITAGIKIPIKDNPNADVLSLSANITFEVK